MDKIIIYNTDDGKTNVKLYANDGTVWLPRQDIAELFQCTRANVALHVKNIYKEGELDESATCKDFLQVQNEGGRKVKRNITFYSLDMILAVGFRVRSPRGVQFRRWANSTLKEYMQKGFVIDDDRLKNPDGRPDYFDELLYRHQMYGFSSSAGCSISILRSATLRATGESPRNLRPFVSYARDTPIFIMS